MRQVRIGAVTTLFVSIFVLASQRGDTAKAPTASQWDRLIESARKEAPRADYHIRYQSVARDRTNKSYPSYHLSASGSPPPPSPGIAVGTTWLDQQHTHSLGKQIVRFPGRDHVYMVWSSIQGFDPSGEWDSFEPIYNSYKISTSTLNPGVGGMPISLGIPALGQFPNVDADDQGAAHAVFHQRDDFGLPLHPYATYFLIPGNTLFVDEGLDSASACGETAWPKFAIQHRAGADDVRHVIARSGNTCDNDRLFYWRFDGATWSAPAILDSAFSPGYVIVADNNSDNVTILFHDIDEPQSSGANNISYYQSTTTGLGWLSGAELGPSFKRLLTSYNDTLAGPQAWRHIDAVYDNSGVLHVVWDEQQIANKTANVAIRHWNDTRNTIRPVVLGYWPTATGLHRLNLTNPSIGIGDGSTLCSAAPGGNNLDYVYLIYTKFGGQTAAEQADTSATGHPNGEIFLTVSSSGGDTWAPASNLTQTRTPDCDPSIPGNECRSEDWVTLNKAVSDLDILYISDRDAGAAPLGEGTYQPNDVMYLRIPGGTGDAEHLCPPLSAGFDGFLSANVECEYHAAPGEIQSNETLTILNLGDAALEGDISVLPGATWLTVTGNADYTIPANAPNLVYPLLMDAAGLSEGVYTGTIRVTHNDPGRPSPIDFIVKFFVIADFNCAQSAVLSTGVE